MKMTMKKHGTTMGTTHKERCHIQGRYKIGGNWGRALGRHKQMERFQS
jgi:hypothetical protein